MKNAESVAVVQEMIRGPWLVDNEILKAGPEKEAKLNRVLGCGRSRQKPERAREQRVSSNPEPLGAVDQAKHCLVVSASAEGKGCVT